MASLFLEEFFGPVATRRVSRPSSDMDQALGTPVAAWIQPIFSELNCFLAIHGNLSQPVFAHSYGRNTLFHPFSL